MEIPLRQWTRDLRDHPLAVRAVRIALRGHQVECPCCKSRFRRFRAFKRPNRVCWVCGAMERHRALWLYLDREAPSMFRSDMSILHVAPERVLRNRFMALPGVRYVGGDLDAEFGPERIDITKLQFADDSFDAVICNHVLEHVPDDQLAMRELRRVLKPGGWALLQVPDVAATTTAEDPTIDDPEEQLRRFGQRDHVRRYGWDYVDRLQAAGFDVGVIRLENELPGAEVERFRLAKPTGVDPIFVGR